MCSASCSPYTQVPPPGIFLCGLSLNLNAIISCCAVPSTGSASPQVLYAGSSSGHISVWDIRAAVRSRQSSSRYGTDTSAPAKAGTPAHPTIASEGGGVTDTSQKQSSAGVRSPLQSMPSSGQGAAAAAAATESDSEESRRGLNAVTATRQATQSREGTAGSLASAAAQVAGVSHPSAISTATPSAAQARTVTSPIAAADHDSSSSYKDTTNNLFDKVPSTPQSAGGNATARRTPTARWAPGSAPARQAVAFGGSRSFSSPAPTFGAASRKGRAMSFGSEVRRLGRQGK